MKHIVLFGANCGKCKKAEVNIKMAVSKNNLEATYEKVIDEKEMMKFNIFYLPSVMIDNVVAFKGTIPTEKEIIKAMNLPAAEQRGILKEKYHSFSQQAAGNLPNHLASAIAFAEAD